jgi:hypothetical protein|uniref:hypothetical protein n=1 Tax=Prosthecobacter sp. TaxID=1965333 RepID=UPI0037841885
MKHTLILLAALLLVPVTAFLSGCSRQPQLMVSNHSSAPLTNVIISGSGFSESIATIAPAEKATVGVMPSGESSLRLEFDAGGKHFTATPDCYFESASYYRVNATVAPDFSVKVDVSTKY